MVDPLTLMKRLEESKTLRKVMFDAYLQPSYLTTKLKATIEEIAVENRLTIQQKNSVHSAENYISIMGFFRKVLIN